MRSAPREWTSRILARDPGVPTDVEGIGQLVVIGLVNTFFGAAIGLIGIVADIVIRDQVLKNRQLFEAPADRLRARS